MLCGLFTAIKRICFCHWLFAILMTIFTVFFIFLGIALIAISVVASDQLNEACSSANSDGDFQKALSELYTRSDSFYCADAQCVCYVGLYNGHGKNVAFVTVAETSTSVTNVQGCSGSLEAAYADYGIDFSDINEIIEYLDLFGKVEKEYSCSGICTQQSIYYFSDSSQGAPEKSCKEPIDEELLKGEILPMGIGYTIIGALLFIVFFIQYGLCCRKDKEEGNYRSSKGRTNESNGRTNNYAQNNQNLSTQRPIKKDNNPYLQ
mmetsp:Transcript_17479/g.15412  ORF Transcript_17479/g.15412 Transcript_17479/m.15412 type:complete len:263 (+) Transcript_17479:236-1024(+)